MRALFALATLAVAPLARAQAAAGSLAGVVTDAVSGLGVANAEVVVFGPDTAATHTAANGSWRLLRLRAGRYVLRVRRLGYAERSREAEVSADAAHAPIAFALTAVPVALDEIVVTAARREQRLKDAVATTELISRSDIETSGAQDVGTVLYEQTGIQIAGGSATSGPPAGTGVYLQGLGSQRVLILLDGLPMTGRISGDFDLSRLPTSMVQRIEVVKGPQSTLYGSDAMGGVINIITRPAGVTSTSGELSTTAGTHGLLTVNGDVRGGDRMFGYDANLGVLENSLAPGIPSVAGALQNRWDANAAVRWSPDSTVTYSASGLGILERQRYTSGTLYYFSDNQQWAARVGATITPSTTLSLAPVLYFSQFDHLFRQTNGLPDPLPGTGQLDRQSLIGLNLPISARTSASTTVDGGVDLKHEWEEADRLSDTTRSINSAEPYAQVTVTRGDLSLVPGIRVSWSEQWGTAATPRLGALWRPTPPLAIRVSLGSGYRAPDFKELYIDFVNANVGYTVVGNPQLQPEHSVGIMTDVEWAGSHLYGRVDGFYNRFRDFIEDTLLAPGLYSYSNVSRGTTSGFELEGGLAQGPVHIEAGYAYLYTHDDATGGPLVGRPTNSARLSVGVGVTSWLSGSVTGLYTGVTPMTTDTTGAVTSARPAYTRFDVRAVARLPYSMELIGGADNVFDAKVGAGWPGFTGRVVYLGASWHAGPGA